MQFMKKYEMSLLFFWFLNFSTIGLELVLDVFATVTKQSSIKFFTVVLKCYMDRYGFAFLCHKY